LFTIIAISEEAGANAVSIKQISGISITIFFMFKYLLFEV
jgi:hypothetical protein